MRKEFLLVVLILSAGCLNKLDRETTVFVQQADKEYRMIDPIAKDQQIKVSAKAESGKFNIYLLLEKDKDEVEKHLEKAKVGDKVLKHELNVTEAVLQATIPANETAVIIVMSADGLMTEVKVRITN